MRNTVAAVVALLLVVPASLLSGCSKGPAHTVEFALLEADLVGGQPDLPVDKIEYFVTTGSDNGPQDGDTLDAGTALPWKQSLTVHGDLYHVFVSLDLNVPSDADFDKVQTAQCQVTVDGKLVQTKSGQGSVNCELDRGALRQQLG